MRHKNLSKFSHFFALPLKSFMKTLKAFIKPFGGTTKKCEIKIHMKFILVKNLEILGIRRVKSRARDTGPHELIFRPFNYQFIS